tara:strand:- start:2658 stop:3293 length:636 start_codon:yes stop_codon:yes gene_type:complete
MKNKIFKFPSNYNSIPAPEIFFQDYFNTLSKLINGIDKNLIKKIYKILDNVIKKKGNIFVAGNGGSASIANHFMCDFNKGVKISSQKKVFPKVISLSNSVELITAIANDINYEEIFTSQIENYLNKDDCIFLISSSGTSANILKLIKYCKNKKVKIILLTGFLSKKNKYKLNVHIDIGCKNYGITEDIFSSIMHMISQYMKLRYQNKKEIL